MSSSNPVAPAEIIPSRYPISEDERNYLNDKIGSLLNRVRVLEEEGDRRDEAFGDLIGKLNENFGNLSKENLDLKRKIGELSAKNGIAHISPVVSDDENEEESAPKRRNVAEEGQKQPSTQHEAQVLAYNSVAWEKEGSIKKAIDGLKALQATPLYNTTKENIPIRLGILYLRLGDLETADANFSKINNKDTAKTMQGIVLALSRKFQEAIACLNSVAPSTKELGNNRLKLLEGLIHFDLIKDNDNSITNFNKLANVLHGAYTPWFKEVGKIFYGGVLYSKKEDAKAMEVLEPLVKEMDEDCKLWEVGLARLWYGSVLVMNEYNEGEQQVSIGVNILKNYQSIDWIFEELIDVLYDLGRFYKEKGIQSKEKTIYGLILKARPSETTARDLLAALAP